MFVWTDHFSSQAWKWSGKSLMKREPGKKKGKKQRMRKREKGTKQTSNVNRSEWHEISVTEVLDLMKHELTTGSISILMIIWSVFFDVGRVKLRFENLDMDKAQRKAFNCLFSWKRVLKIKRRDRKLQGRRREKEKEDSDQNTSKSFLLLKTEERICCIMLREDQNIKYQQKIMHWLINTVFSKSAQKNKHSTLFYM